MSVMKLNWPETVRGGQLNDFSCEVTLGSGLLNPFPADPSLCEPVGPSGKALGW